ncbi:unnamed protein product [Ixodes pacificus]
MPVLQARIFFFFCSRERKQVNSSGKKQAAKASARPKIDKPAKDCKRKFRPVWKETYTWLQYEEIKNTMHCVLCRDAYFGQEKCVPFVEGTNNFKLSVIQKHEKTSAHRNLLDKTEAERKVVVAKSVKSRKKSLKEEDSRARFELLFKIVYQIQKNKLSFSQFPILVSQQIQNGVPLEGRYTNHHHVVPDFSKYIAMSMINDTVADIHQAKHFGIILDDVSDVLGSCKDAVFITYIKDCCRHTKYLGLVENYNGVGIALSLVEMLAKFGLPSPFEKLLCLTMDGQPLHRVEKEGLRMALGKEAPVLYSMHCLAHKLECSVKPILFEHPQVRHCVDTLYKLFCFLKDLQKKTGHSIDVWTPMSTMDQFTHSSNPKWLVFSLKFLLATLEKLGTITIFLTDTYHNLDRKMRLDAAEILTSLKNSTFVAYLHLLKEIFEALQNFQDRVADGCPLPCYAVQEELKSTASVIMNHIILGPCLVPVLQELQARSGFFQGMPVTHDFDIQSFHSSADELCRTVSLQIFLMAEQSSPSICKFSVLDPKNWPLDSDTLLGAYGIQRVRELSEEMRPLLSLKCPADIIQEWCSYKAFVQSSLAESLRKDFNSLAAVMISRFSNIYPSICTFLTAAMLLSPSCSVTRNGFHELCLIKESRKNVLTEDTLWQTMVINMNGASLEDWDPEPVVDLWLKTSLRRPNNRTKLTADTGTLSQAHGVNDVTDCVLQNCDLLVITGELCEEPMACDNAEGLM